MIEQSERIISSLVSSENFPDYDSGGTS